MRSENQPVARRVRVRNMAYLALVLAVLWMAFSGKTDALHLAYGALSIALVLLLTSSLLISRRDPEQAAYIGRFNWSAAIVYVFWLLKEIVVANVQVAWLIIRPSMPVNPALVVFRTGMKGALAKTVLANSIILTPGTFTLRVHDDRFLVHTLHEKLTGSLLDGTMQRKVGVLFREELVEDMQIAFLSDPAEVRTEIEKWSS